MMMEKMRIVLKHDDGEGGGDADSDGSDDVEDTEKGDSDDV